MDIFKGFGGMALRAARPELTIVDVVRTVAGNAIAGGMRYHLYRLAMAAVAMHLGVRAINLEL